MLVMVFPDRLLVNRGSWVETFSKYSYVLFSEKSSDDNEESLVGVSAIHVLPDNEPCGLCGSSTWWITARMPTVWIARRSPMT